jgi:protein-disulfide isomerase
MIKKILFFLSIITLANNLFASPLSEDQLNQIDQRIDSRIEKYMQGQQMDQRVEQGIQAFIQKQNQLAQQRQRAAAQQANLAAKVDITKDHILGDNQAEYSLIEYGDFECPFCRRFHPTAHSFITQHKDVNWVFRNFPLSFHQPANQVEAVAAECVAELKGNDAYWKFTNFVFKNTSGNGKGISAQIMQKLIKQLKVNTDKFKDCQKSGRFDAKIQAQIDDGSRAGVTGTPGNFLRYNPTGETIAIPGALPITQLNAAFAELKKRVAAKKH